MSSDFLFCSAKVPAFDARAATKSIPLIDDHNGAPALCQMQGGGQPGDAGADNHHIGHFGHAARSVGARTTFDGLGFLLKDGARRAPDILSAMEAGEERLGPGVLRIV